MGETYTYRVRAYASGKWDSYQTRKLVYNPFTDVDENKISFKYISWGYNNQILKGSGSIFDPNGGCTRSDFVIMLWKMNGRPKVKGNEEFPFKDVTGSLSRQAVHWAYSEGIIVGTSKTTFSPHAKVNRSNIALMLWKMAGQPKEKGDFPFTDVPGSKSQKAVLWLSNHGITSGTSPTTFSPHNTCTRAQLVTFLYKYNKEYKVIKDS